MNAIEQVQEAWRRAASELGFEFVSPHAIEDGERRTEYHGFIRNFGGPIGTVFIAGESFDVGIGDCALIAKQQGYFFSRLNAEVYGTFDREVFVETLTDWGYFGESGVAPEWLSPPK